MALIDHTALQQQTEGTALQTWARQLPGQLERLFAERRHGDFDRWMKILSRLPELPPDQLRIDAGIISVCADQPPDPALPAQIEALLLQLHPWRKGPFSLHGVHIDSEWRCDLKWQRLAAHISSLRGRAVLDVGCGNGYYCWRMAGAGARLVVGIDPTQLYLAQFSAVRHFLGRGHAVHLLPLAMESMPRNMQAFDTVFSMGVLYHRRSPIDHLLELKDCLRPGGELVLETLVIEGKDGQVLLPRGRYAKMRNTWFLPSPMTLCGWLERCGYRDVRLLSVTVTTIEEQRTTRWMRFESLTDFLDPKDPDRTLEGYPAPRRAMLLARRA